jgi:uncharacterized protein (DUF2336 family)
VGLTAIDLGDMGRLAQLVTNPGNVQREELYLAVASLYRVQGTYLNARERELMHDILKRLARDVEMAIRISLAERLADDATAPHDLILLLADDTIEVARPLILRSPLISDEDALDLIAQADGKHQEAFASRPFIGEPVSDALARSESETVLVALVRNVTARIASVTYETLVEKSRQFASLQTPLAHRRDLPPTLAQKMCDWCSDALRTYISSNFKMGIEEIGSALADAELTVRAPLPLAKSPPADASRKLIEKLAVAGQLKAGFLLRVLHQGQGDLFDQALARMLELPEETMRRALYEEGPRTVALACRAVGIDRCVFTTVYNLSRQAHGMKAALTAEDKADVEAVFNTCSKLEATTRLRAPRLN